LGELEGKLASALVAVVLEGLVEVETLREAVAAYLGADGGRVRVASLGGGRMVLLGLSRVELGRLVFRVLRCGEGVVRCRWPVRSDGALAERPPSGARRVLIEGVPLFLRTVEVVAAVVAPFARLRRCSGTGLKEADLSRIEAWVEVKPGRRLVERSVLRWGSSAWLLRVSWGSENPRSFAEVVGGGAAATCGGDGGRRAEVGRTVFGKTEGRGGDHGGDLGVNVIPVARSVADDAAGMQRAAAVSAEEAGELNATLNLGSPAGCGSVGVDARAPALEEVAGGGLGSGERDPVTGFGGSGAVAGSDPFACSSSRPLVCAEEGRKAAGGVS
jgi:hypothetical protein